MGGQNVSGVKTSPGASDSSVLRAAGAMGIATFFSRILGLVREQVFAYLFGAGHATDAFQIAFRIPNLLRDLFAEGAMSASLVATFTEAREKQGERRAWRLAGLAFRVLFVGVGVLAVLGIIFAPELVDLYASAYREVPGKYELTVSMTRMIFPFFPLVALAAAYMGVLNASGKFFLPAFASALFNFASITTGVIFVALAPLLGREPIEGMAIGVVIGGAVQAFCQLPTLYRVGYRWQPRDPTEPAWYQDPGLKRMLWLILPGTVGLAATQVNILVNSVLATSQGAGAVSWLNYASRLMQFPIGLFGVSLASATLPRVSKLWVQDDGPGVAQTLRSSLRQVLAINLPASAGLIALGEPILRMIFEYGRFKPDDTQATAMALAMYALGLTAYSAVKVLVPACYAMGNSRLPVISSAVVVALNIGINLLLVGRLGYWGLALGTSIAATLNLVFLFVGVGTLLGVKGQKLWDSSLGKALVQQLFLSLLMGAACWASFRWLDTVIPDEVLGTASRVFVRTFKVCGTVTEGVVLTALIAKVLKIEDTLAAAEVFSSRVKKKLSRGSK